MIKLLEDLVSKTSHDSIKYKWLGGSHISELNKLSLIVFNNIEKLPFPIYIYKLKKGIIHNFRTKKSLFKKRELLLYKDY